jgi:dTDP-L-rhamnose 4-epimerase
MGFGIAAVSGSIPETGMSMNVLVTGGAGFIGTHLVRKLLGSGHTVAVLDNFHPQVHGSVRSLAPDIGEHVELIFGDVREKEVFHGALRGRDVVVHLAAETGTGQSMYEVLRYEEVNVRGTAVLMDFLINSRSSRIEKVIVASSRAIYGEGRYECGVHGPVFPAGRSVEHMRRGRFEPLCPTCGIGCSVLPTDETAPLQPASMYGLTKQVQEQMVLLYARSLGLAGYALRYQNVYGPGQSLNNPYTGILAIFSTLARQNQPIRIFEDGAESRDFVHVEDVVDLTSRVVSSEYAGVETVNVGSGIGTSVLDVAHRIVDELGSSSQIRITGEFRTGDIRHNVADLRKANHLFGFEPKWSFGNGLRDFLRWSVETESSGSGYEDSLKQLDAAGLYHRSSASKQL